MFYQAILRLHDEYRATPLARYFRKPMFRIALLFVEEGTLLAQAFDLGSLQVTGEAAQVASGVASFRTIGSASFTVSRLSTAESRALRPLPFDATPRLAHDSAATVQVSPSDKEPL